MGCDSSKLLPQHQLDGFDTKNNNPIVFIKAFPKNPQHDSKSKGIQYLALVPMSPSFFPKPESLTELHQARCSDNAVLKMFCSFKNRPKAGSPELCGQPVISIEEYYRRLVTSLANSPERNPIPVVIYLWNPATTNTTPASSSSPSSHWEQVGYIGCRTCNFASQMKPSGEVGIFLCQKARGLSLATTIARSMCWFLKETSPPSLSSSDANSTSQKKPSLPLPPSHVEFSTRLDNRPVLDMLSTMSILIERVRIQALYQQSMMTMSMSSMAMMTTSKSQNHFAPSFSGIDHTATMDFDEDVLQKVESSQHQQQGCTPSASNTFTYNVNDDDTDNMSLMKQQQKSSVMMMQGDHTSSGLLLANQQQQQQQQSSSLSSSSGTSLLPFSIECSPLDSSSFTERSQDFLRAESIIGPDQDEDAFIEEHREEFLNGNFDDIVSKYGLDERMKFKIGAQDCEKIVTFLADTLQTLPSVGTTVEEQLMVKTLVNSFTTATCKPCNYFLSATNMPPPPLPTREEVEQAKISTSSSVSVGSSNTTVTHHQHSHSLLDSHVHHTSSGSLLHSTSSSNFVNTPASTSSSSNNLLVQQQQQQQRFVNPQNNLLSAPNVNGNNTIIISRSTTSSLSSKNSMHRHSITPSSTSSSSGGGNKILPIIDSMPVWSQSVLGDLIEGCRKSTELRKLQNNSKKKKQPQTSSSSSSPTLNNTNEQQQQQQHHEGKYQKVANAPAPVNGFFTHQQQQSKKQLVRQHYKQQKQMKKQQHQQQGKNQHDAGHNDYDDTEQHYYQQQQEQHYQQHHYQHQHQHQHQHHHPHHYQEQQMIQQPSAPATAPAPVYPEKYFYDEPLVAQQQQQQQQHQNHHHHHHQSSYYHPHHQQPQQQQHQPAYHHHHQDHHHQYYHEQPMKKPPIAVFVPPPPPPQQQQQQQQPPTTSTTANITTPNNKGRARSKLAEAFLGEVRK